MNREALINKRFMELERANRHANLTTLWEQSRTEVTTSQDAADAATIRLLLGSELVSQMETIKAALATAYSVTHDKGQSVLEKEERVPASWLAVNAAREAYMQAREALLVRKLSEAGLNMCTMCGQAKPAAEVQLAAVKKRVMHSDSDCSYNSWSWLADYLDIHMLCRKCNAKSTLIPKEVNSDGVIGITYSLVIAAKPQNGTYALVQNGRWEDLPKDGHDLTGNKPWKSARLYFDFGVPPELQTRNYRLFIAEDQRDPILVFNAEAS